MLLPSIVTLTVRTGVTFYTGFFEREYVLRVFTNNERSAIITIEVANKTPSGYTQGNSKATLIECEELDLPVTGTAKQWLAKLALKHDKLLKTASGCSYYNKCIAVTKVQLQKFSEQ